LIKYHSHDFQHVDIQDYPAAQHGDDYKKLFIFTYVYSLILVQYQRCLLIFL